MPIARLISLLSHRLFFFVPIIGLSSMCCAQELAIHSVLVPTAGNPTTAIEAQHGRYIFVSVTNVGAPNFGGPDSAASTRKGVVSGIQVFRQTGLLGLHRHPRAIGFVPTGGAGANGLALLRGEKTLAVGVGDDGVAFLDVDALIRGSAVPVFAAQGHGAGTFDVVATADGKYVFSANEYGILEGQRGNVGVVATGIDAKGRVAHPVTLRQIPAGDVVPSLGLSPDDTRLYVLSELVPAIDARPIAGSTNKSLIKADCVQVENTPPRTNGLVTVIDVQLAIDSVGGEVLSRVAAGCSPVRVAEAADRSALYISARGDDSVLVYDPARMESDPEHSFVRLFASGGVAPVGLRLFAHDRWLAVANSNRFATANGTFSAISISGAAEDPHPTSVSAGAFPRNITISHDGETLYLTNYTSRTLQIIKPHRTKM
jgi:DNA-binding beta-propeller fold protein YncE